MIQLNFKNHLRMTVGTLLVLLVAAFLKSKLGNRTPANALEQGLAIMARTGLSERDENELTAGYYEGLLDGAQQTSQANRGLLGTLGIIKPAPADWLVLSKTTAIRWRKDFLKFDMQPNVDIPFTGDRLKTNSWGLRDGPYEQAKPPDTRRIALCGSSIAMGSGIPSEQGYEALLEAWLNTRRDCPQVRRYEIINFSVPGYKLTQQFETAVDRAQQFSPDVTIIELNFISLSSNWSDHIARLVRDGDDLKYEFIRRVVEKAQLKRSDSIGKIHSKLMPYNSDIVEGVLRNAKEKIEERGSRLVVLRVPYPNAAFLLRTQFDEMLGRVADLHLPVIDATDAFGGHSAEDIILRPWDHHPNALGHRLIFDSIEQAIAKDGGVRTVILGCDGQRPVTASSGQERTITEPPL